MKKERLTLADLRRMDFRARAAEHLLYDKVDKMLAGVKVSRETKRLSVEAACLKELYRAMCRLRRLGINLTRGTEYDRGIQHQLWPDSHRLEQDAQLFRKRNIKRRRNISRRQTISLD